MNAVDFRTVRWVSGVSPSAVGVPIQTLLRPTGLVALWSNMPEDVKVGIVMVAVAGCSIDLFDKDKFEAYIPNQAEWMKNICSLTAAILTVSLSSAKAQEDG